MMKFPALLASACLAALFATMNTVTAPVLAQTAAATAPAEAAAAETDDNTLTPEEMEVLVARIALYPDDLVAAVVSASLYPLDLVQAARFLDEKEKKKDLKPDTKWDGSVISLLNYPEIVKMMSDDLDWTEALGQAAVNQQEDLLAAIQQLREKAVAMGVLKSDDKVVVEQASAPPPAPAQAGAPPPPAYAPAETIVIKSADPQVIYVPQYQPQMLYDPYYVMPPQPIYYPPPYPAYYFPTAPYWAGFVTGAVWRAPSTGGAIASTAAMSTSTSTGTAATSTSATSTSAASMWTGSISTAEHRPQQSRSQPARSFEGGRQQARPVEDRPEQAQR